ncbi:hypothetical protein MKX83_24525 [Cytobacillus sp. FSL M8-0252]|uniref:hypothetical protein n=1 Tax=Cytobacillus sp. FSL M8-0252 TaxID=2921621 RepID=UPI0030F8B060
MAKEIQIKFTVNENQKSRLDKLAKQREVTVNQFAKLTALGVRMTPAPVIDISKNHMEETELLNEILRYFHEHPDGDASLFISSKFDEELISKIKAYLKN